MVTTMTPEEKAKELVDKYMKECNIAIAGAYSIWKTLAKKQAIIAVDEILSACPIELVGNSGKFIYKNNYWEQVKQAIQSL